MTITRLWQAGFETQSDEGLDLMIGVTAVSSLNPNTGSWGMRTIMSASNQYFGKIVPATRQIRAGADFYTTHLASAWNPGQLITIRDSTTAQLAYVRIQRDINSNSTQAHLSLYVGGVLRDSSGIVVPITTHQYLAVDCKIDSSSGWVTVYFNGVEILSYSGNTGNTDIDNVCFGNITLDMGTGGDIYWDDPYIDDTTGEGSATVPPIHRFYMINPDAAGNYTQWDASVGNNYECVDEIPPDGADYVYTDVVDELDSYAMDTFTLADGQTIIAMLPTIWGYRVESIEQIAIGTRYSGTDLIGSDQDMPTGSWGVFFERQTTKPGGGSWDQTSLDGLETLIKSRGF